jgi:hypothetical protein
MGSLWKKLGKEAEEEIDRGRGQVFGVAKSIGASRIASCWIFLSMR